MWVIIFLLFTLLFLLAYLDTRKPENFPPGPSWLPMLGSALEVDKFRQKFRLLALGIANISKSHGPILGVRIGRDVQVFLHGYEPIKQMLTEDVFDGRPIGPFYMERTFGKRRGILFTDQGFWQEQRRFVIKNLREFGFGRRDMGDAIAEEAQELVKSITNSMHDKNSVVLQVSNMFNISTINTLWSMLVGTRYDLENGELRHLQRIMADLFKKIDLVGCLFGQFPFLRYLAPERSGYNTYIKTHIPIWKFLTDEIENHKQNFKNGEAKDFVDKYLEELEASGEKTNFTELQLMAICMDLFMAGSETTSRTLEMFMLNILLNQDVQKKAQEEIDQVIGNNRMPLISDKIKYVLNQQIVQLLIKFPSMPYVEAMVLETIRHISGRSFIVPHRALKDTTMEGYFIPKVINFCHFYFISYKLSFRTLWLSRI